MLEQVLCATGMQGLWMSEEGSGTGITGDCELACGYENPPGASERAVMLSSPQSKEF